MPVWMDLCNRNGSYIAKINFMQFWTNLRDRKCSYATEINFMRIWTDLRNRKNLRVIGFRKPKDPFPDMPLATSPPMEGRGKNEEEKIKQVEKDLGSPLLKVYKDNFGRDKLYRDTLKDTPSWYTPGGGSTQFYTPREEPTPTGKASSQTSGVRPAAVTVPSQ